MWATAGSFTTQGFPVAGAADRSRKCRSPSLLAGGQFEFALTRAHDSIGMQWSRARSRLGEARYRALSNNCEHLCEWCIYGEHRSRQVEVLRSRSLQVVQAVRQLVGAPLRLLSLLGLSGRRRSLPGKYAP
jgi:hypothetical protein